MKSPYTYAVDVASNCRTFSDFNFPNPAPTANSGSKITTKPYK